MTNHLRLTPERYAAAMQPGVRQTEHCPACGSPIAQIAKIRPGMVEYTCSCGAHGLVLLERTVEVVR